MGISFIILLILFGIGIVLLEIFVIPGTTVVGLFGGLLMILGVILGYATQDNIWVGHATLAGTLAATGILTYLALRVLRSSNYPLTDVVDGQMNVREELGLQPGDMGTAVTDLRPNGKALFGDAKVEVFSQGDFLVNGTQVQIIKLTSDKIYVKAV